VISDHSPCIAELKRLSEGDFMKAWGGIASLQLGLPIIWTEARKRGFSVFDIQKWMCEEPAKLVRLSDAKGPIKVGRDADFVIWNPDESFVVDQSKLLFKNRLSPYHGETLFGRVARTVLRGKVVFDGANVAQLPEGVRVVPTRTSSRASYPTPKLPPIERLNSLDRKIFQQSINLLFETAPPLFEPLWERRPYDTYEQLIDTAESVIRNLGSDDRIAVINAHPRIGLNPAQLSSLSKKEQGSQNTEEIFEELRKLNSEYEGKFGFKFVVFVNGRQKSEIIPVLRERLKSAREVELELGLSEMMAIAKDRLKKLN